LYVLDNRGRSLARVRQALELPRGARAALRGPPAG
jgi:hypothetical protein